MAEAYIYDAVRSPRGKGRKDGSLHEVTAARLSAQILNAVKERNNLEGHAVEDVIWGNATQVMEQGGCLARTAVLASELDQRIPGLSINRFCASGMEAVNLAAPRQRHAVDGVAEPGLPSDGRGDARLRQGRADEIPASGEDQPHPPCGQFQRHRGRLGGGADRLQGIWRAVWPDPARKNTCNRQDRAGSHHHVDRPRPGDRAYHEVERSDKEVGMATLCVASGMGAATIIERV